MPTRMKRDRYLPLIVGLGLAVALLKAATDKGETGNAKASKDDLSGKDYDREVKIARDERSQREQDRKLMLDRPEIRDGWIGLSHERRIIGLQDRDYVITETGVGRGMGIAPQVIENPATGARLSIDSGGLRDRYVGGTLSLRKGDAPHSFIMAWSDDHHGRRVVTVEYAPLTNYYPGAGGGLDADSFYKLGDFLTWKNPDFIFRRMMGERFYLDQRGSDYHGAAGLEKYRRDLDDYLDSYVDKYYASQGKNPVAGRRNPDLIPRS